VYDRETGIIGSPATIDEALEVVEAILRMELRKAIKAIPPAARPKLPKLFGGA
jgi:hypothetical protein